MDKLDAKVTVMEPVDSPPSASPAPASSCSSLVDSWGSMRSICPYRLFGLCKRTDTEYTGDNLTNMLM